MKGKIVMNTFNNIEDENYKVEAQEKWGKTDTYKEYSEKTKDYSKEKWNNILDEMNDIFIEFANYMKNGDKPNSLEVQDLVEKLQVHISENYYLCTNEILLGLGQMYVMDERFKNNINKCAEGTAEFVYEAIKIYCKK